MSCRVVLLFVCNVDNTIRGDISFIVIADAVVVVDSRSNRTRASDQDVFVDAIETDMLDARALRTFFDIDFQKQSFSSRPQKILLWDVAVAVNRSRHVGRECLLSKCDFVFNRQKHARVQR